MSLRPRANRKECSPSGAISNTSRDVARSAINKIAYRFGHVLGCLEKEDDVNGLIGTVAGFIRYGSVVGVSVEWHPLIIRLLQALTPGGNKGLAHVKSIGETAMKRMDDDVASSAGEKSGLGKYQQQKQQQPHSFVSVMQERHLRDPSTFTRDDVIYHMIPNVAAGADTTSEPQRCSLLPLENSPSSRSTSRRIGQLGCSPRKKNSRECDSDDGSSRFAVLASGPEGNVEDVSRSRQ
ncbi:MAG: hypothetical protein Q9177_002680 [Variospora cf. flavescens]